MNLSVLKLWFAGGLISVCFSGSAFAQAMYKCVQSGHTTYQATPCPQQAKQNTLDLKLKTPSAASTAATSSGPANSPEVERTIEFMSTYQACAGVIKLFADEMSGPYEQWRVRNANMVARIEKDPALLAQIEKRTAVKRNGKAGICRPVGLELRGVKE